MIRALQQSSRLKPIIVIFIALYLAAQIVMPRLRLSLIPNFDTSCYSGSLSYIEKISPDGSCGANGGNFVGFPFVVNFHYNSRPQQLATLLIDLLPVAIAASLLWIVQKRRKLLKPEEA